MNKKEELLRALTELLGPEKVSCDEPMKRHTSFRVGGPADFYLEPCGEEDLAAALRLLTSEEIPYFVMGNGSNLLVSDEGFRGAVIRFGKQMERVSIEENVVTAEAGALLSAISARAREASLSGLEFAGGIPGSLGGACVMNAGAYGGEMKQVLSEVLCLNEDFEEELLPAEELALSYRNSIFSKRKLIALRAKMVLREGRISEIAEQMEDFRRRRTEKQPLDLPSAGSTFKRPEGYFAGKLIMDAGLRGFRVGGASVSEKHCGFVVNDRGATASEIRQLICEVQRIVKEDSGVELEPEVRFLGDF